MTASLLEELRAGTRGAHAQMEAVPALSCLLSPDLTMGAYIHALRGLQSFQAGLGTRLRSVLTGSLRPLCPDDSGAQALALDLAWCGASRRRPMALGGAVSHVQAALGGVYVLEGSALGARVIGRAVAVSLHVSPGRGGQFFCGATADAARTRWRGLVASLDELGAQMDAAGRQRVVAGANAVFNALGQVLLDAGPREKSRRHEASLPGARRRQADIRPATN
jgi:heme oxygenase